MGYMSVFSFFDLKNAFSVPHERREKAEEAPARLFVEKRHCLECCRVLMRCVINTNSNIDPNSKTKF